MDKFKQCQFNISLEELKRLNCICEKYKIRQAEAIVKCVDAYIDGQLEEKLYEEIIVSGWSKKIVNIEENLYNKFAIEASFRCRTLVSMIRFAINAFYEHEFVL